MKLLLYSHFFTPGVGGVETIVLSLARGLSEARSSDGRPEFDLTLVTETPAANFDDRSLPFPVVRQPGWRQLWRLIRAADVLHLAGPALPPLFLAKLARKPVVVEHHGYQAVCPNGLLLYQPDRSICPGHFQAARYAKCLHCQSTEMSWLQSCKSLLLTFPRNSLAAAASCNIAVSNHVSQRIALPRSQVIYHGIENTPLTSVSVPENSGQPGTPLNIRFAFVGRFVQEKGLTVLLDAVQLLRRQRRDFELLLIGDGPLRPHLESTVARAGLNDTVRITGFLQGAALAQALSEIHVVVMPSIWEETAGLAAIEQMMRARPVIASNIGGLGEMVGDAGLLARPGDAADLARCMLEVLQDPALLSTLGRKARARAESLFRRERMTADHARLYRQQLP
jgi:glycogen(starch) synthase